MINSGFDVNKMTVEEIYNEGVRLMEGVAKHIESKNTELAQKQYNLGLQMFWEASQQNYLQAHIQLANYYDYQVKDKRTAFEYYLKAAGLGDSKSRYIVAIFLHRGWGVEVNKSSAYMIMKDLANEGFDYAQLDLALFYLNGEGCEKNPEKAFYYFSKAAKQGHAVAQNDLGLCYLNGEGVEADPFEAIFWFQQAMNNNNYEGLFNIGLMLFNGNLIQQDKSAGVECFMIGAKNNEPNCIRVLQEMGVDLNEIPDDIVLKFKIEPLKKH
jgi:TPR repeat protein